MPEVRLALRVRAPVERCFDLARSIDLHVDGLRRTGESAVAGVTAGLIGAGESVTWRARHFGIVQELTARIVAFDRPRFFCDAMTRGAFAGFAHGHWFAALDDGRTLITDVFRFRAPFGAAGRIAEACVLAPYLHRLLRGRLTHLRAIAESETAWRRYTR